MLEFCLQGLKEITDSAVQKKVKDALHLVAVVIACLSALRILEKAQGSDAKDFLENRLRIGHFAASVQQCAFVLVRFAGPGACR